MSFEVIPAIDLLGGQAVRLTQGRYEEATVYAANPAEVAARFGRAISHDKGRGCDAGAYGGDSGVSGADL